MTTYYLAAVKHGTKTFYVDWKGDLVERGGQALWHLDPTKAQDTLINHRLDDLLRGSTSVASFQGDFPNTLLAMRASSGVL